MACHVVDVTFVVDMISLVTCPVVCHRIHTLLPESVTQMIWLHYCINGGSFPVVSKDQHEWSLPLDRVEAVLLSNYK